MLSNAKTPGLKVYAELGAHHSTELLCPHDQLRNREPKSYL